MGFVASNVGGILHKYFGRIADEVAQILSILIAGPAEANTAFMIHLKKQSPSLASPIRILSSMVDDRSQKPSREK